MRRRGLRTTIGAAVAALSLAAVAMPAAADPGGKQECSYQLNPYIGWVKVCLTAPPETGCDPWTQSCPAPGCDPDKASCLPAP